MTKFDHINKGMLAVYVLCADDHAVKIGVSKNPGHRATAIQTGQDREIRVFWAVRLARKDARTVERETHRRLRQAATHIRGEWYMFGPAQAVAEIKQEIARRGLTSSADLTYGWEDRA